MGPCHFRTEGVQQRPELSGDYTVSDDGTITVPLLGSVKVAGLTSGEIQKALSESFGDILGRNGLVNILSVERSPIYVLGPVKNPVRSSMCQADSSACTLSGGGARTERWHGALAENGGGA